MNYKILEKIVNWKNLVSIEKDKAEMYKVVEQPLMQYYIHQNASGDDFSATAGFKEFMDYIMADVAIGVYENNMCWTYYDCEGKAIFTIDHRGKVTTDFSIPFKRIEKLEEPSFTFLIYADDKAWNAQEISGKKIKASGSILSDLLERLEDKIHNYKEKV